jgi:hypothetical protein
VTESDESLRPSLTDSALRLAVSCPGGLALVFDTDSWALPLIFVFASGHAYSHFQISADQTAGFSNLPAPGRSLGLGAASAAQGPTGPSSDDSVMRPRRARTLTALAVLLRKSLKNQRLY